MKKILFILFSLIFATSLFAQKEEAIAWQELKDFHDMVSPIYHNAEKGNYATVRDSSKLLLKRAQTLNKASLPDGLNKTTFKSLTKKLVADTKEVNEAVKAKKTDAEIKPLLHQVHEDFHEILEKSEAGKK
ncbi:MAG: hypothetical protein NTZ19_07960 [Bacteroidetes bacterium]|nr:hypothetical protein [Bacteroidota bacterium]